VRVQYLLGKCVVQCLVIFTLLKYVSLTVGVMIGQSIVSRMESF